MVLKLTAKVEERQLKAYLKRLDKNRGKPLATRAEKTTLAASKRVLVPRIKAAAPRRKGGRGGVVDFGGRRGGQLRRSVKAKSLRKRGREPIRPTWVGAWRFYSHMVIGGTKRHALDSRGGQWAAFAVGEVRPLAGMQHPGSRANPFLDRGADGALPDVYRLIRRDVFSVK